MKRNSGFTILELLCVLGIVGILVAFLLPTVQRLRASARSTDCLNRIRQLGLAAKMYESARGHLPPGTLGFSQLFEFEGNWFEPTSPYYWKRAQHTSSLALVLPFMELESLYRRYEGVSYNAYVLLDEYADSNGIPFYSWYGEIPGFGQLATARIPTFECPSAPPVDTAWMYVLGASQPVTDMANGKLDAYTFFDLNDFRPDDYAPTNYLGCAGAHSGGFSPDPERRRYTGVMSSRAPVSSSSVLDGTSHTIMYGEALGGIWKARPYASTCWLVGGLARGRGNLPWKASYDPNEPRSRLLGNTHFSSPFGFASSHPGFVNFAFTDGSVRSINPSITAATFYNLCGMSDGEWTWQ